MLKTLVFAASMLLIGYNQKTCVEKENWLKGGKKKVGNIFDPENSQKFNEKAPNFLGGGSFGRVFKIDYSPEGNTSIDVALKVIDIKEFFKNSPDNSKEYVRQRIEKEATYMKEFNKKDKAHFAEFYACFYDEQNYYIISELLDFELQDPLFMKAFDEAPLLEKLTLMLDMAKAVKIIHEFPGEKSKNEKENAHSIPLKVAHNDIKPENFMLSVKYPPRVKIIDMGTVCPIGASMWSGTRSFIPPEKIQNPDYKIQTSNDIWSLGITFGRLLNKDNKRWPIEEFTKQLNKGKNFDETFYSDFITKFKSSSLKIIQNNQDNSKTPEIWKELIKYIADYMLNVEVGSRKNINNIVKDLNNFKTKLGKSKSSSSKDNENSFYPSIEAELKRESLNLDKKRHKNNDFEERLEDPEKTIFKSYII